MVQMQVAQVLESIYDPLFLECSYGFRPGAGCHDAFKALHNHLFRYDVETVIDVDLANFFGTIDRSVLEGFLRQERSCDEKFLRYVVRMLKAGVLSDGEFVWRGRGAQGTSAARSSRICGPPRDRRVVRDVVKAHCRGRIALFRYADDLVICCQYVLRRRSASERFSRAPGHIRPQLNAAKTKMVSFSKGRSCGQKQGTFDFLGFTCFLSRSQKGVVVPKVKTSAHVPCEIQEGADWASRLAESKGCRKSGGDSAPKCADM